MRQVVSFLVVFFWVALSFSSGAQAHMFNPQSTEPISPPLLNTKSVVFSTPPLEHPVWEDLDNDGDIDLAIYFHETTQPFIAKDCIVNCVSNYLLMAQGTLSIWINDNGIYKQLVLSNNHFDGQFNSLVVFDYDNDGRRDLLLTLKGSITPSMADNNAMTSRNVVLLRQQVSDNATTFTDVSDVVQLPPDLPSNIVLLDANRDGYTDIVAVADDNSPRLLKFNPQGGALKQGEFEDVTYLSFLPSDADLSVITSVDFDNDGLVDIVGHHGKYGDGGLRWFKNNGDNSFTELTAVTTLTNSWVTKIIPSDIDGDGKQDLVVFENLNFLSTSSSDSVSDAAGTQIRILKNEVEIQGKFKLLESSGLFFPGAMDDEGYGLTVGDYDNDGDIDFVKGEKNSARTNLIENISITNAPVQFAIVDNAVSGIVDSNNAGMVAMNDLNNDGHVDLALPGIFGAQGDFDHLYNLKLSSNSIMASANHYLKINIKGQALGKGPGHSGDALGARVEVTANGLVQTRQILANFGAMHDLHFGLGTATAASIKIYWPNGQITQKVLDGLTPDKSVDRTIGFMEPPMGAAFFVPFEDEMERIFDDGQEQSLEDRNATFTFLQNTFPHIASGKKSRLELLSIFQEQGSNDKGLTLRNPGQTWGSGTSAQFFQDLTDPAKANLSERELYFAYDLRHNSRKDLNVSLAVALSDTDLTIVLQGNYELLPEAEPVYKNMKTGQIVNLGRGFAGEVVINGETIRYINRVGNILNVGTLANRGIRHSLALSHPVDSAVFLGYDFMLGSKDPGLKGGGVNAKGELQLGNTSTPTNGDFFTVRTYNSALWYGKNAAKYGKWYGVPGIYFYHFHRTKETHLIGIDYVPPGYTGGIAQYQHDKWHRWEIRVKLNTPGAIPDPDNPGQTMPLYSDGIVQAWFDGQLVYDRSNIAFTQYPEKIINWLSFAGHFGGRGDKFQTQKDERRDFDNFAISKMPIYGAYAH